MRVTQARWTELGGWLPEVNQWPGRSVNVVFLFGSTAALRREDLMATLRGSAPGAVFFGCSTAGEIQNAEVRDDTLSATFVEFEYSRAAFRAVPVADGVASRVAGSELAGKIDPAGLRHVIVLCDGLRVNGTELVRGLRDSLPAGTPVTGGLAADGDRFQETLVVSGESARSGLATALALYGDRLHAACGSMGGWDQFGPERLVTRSSGNVLYELDSKSALALYKLYLGDHSVDLPASGLLFPLGIRSDHKGRIVVRTILGVNEAEQSLTFAGDIPEGWYARLMRANFDRLIDGATGAARAGVEKLGAVAPDLALLISCVGRKRILKQRVEEEIEAVREVLGDRAAIAGFYSYGEIAPFAAGTPCELHNQTMTVTTLREE